MFQRRTIRNLGRILFLIILPLLIGLWAAPQVFPQPAVALITLETDIWALSADLVMRQIEEVRQSPNIKAVVLRINSPGGAVVPSQQLYLEIQSLRREMPVVGSLNDLATSGGFYLALATEPIYAKPSSTIGNVGVWSVVPPDVGVNDSILASGPFKMTATNREHFAHELEGIKHEFLAVVSTQRGERLKISPEELSKGLAYPGREALALGLIDEIGSERDAIEKAADLAGLKNYETIDLQALVIANLYGEEMPFFFRPWHEQPWIGAPEPSTGQRQLPPGVYMLYDMQLGGAK